MPEKSDKRGWKELLARMAEFAGAVRERETARRARERHAIEQRIAALERLPQNKDRDRLIRSLREDLQKLRG